MKVKRIRDVERKQQNPNAMKLGLYREGEIAWIDTLCEYERYKPWDACETLVLYQTVRKVLYEENPLTERTVVDEYLTAASCLLIQLAWYNETSCPDFADKMNEITSLAMLIELCFVPKPKDEKPEREKLLERLSRKLRRHLARNSSAALRLTTAREALAPYRERTRRDRNGRNIMTLRLSPTDPDEETFEMDEETCVASALTREEIVLTEGRDETDDKDNEDDDWLKSHEIRRRFSHCVFLATTWHELIERYDLGARAGVVVCKKVKKMVQKGNLCAVSVYLDGDLPSGRRETCVDALVWFENALIDELGSHVKVFYVPWDDAPQPGARLPVMLGRRYGANADKIAKPKSKRSRGGARIEEEADPKGRADRTRFKMAHKVTKIINVFLTVATSADAFGTPVKNYVVTLARSTVGVLLGNEEPEKPVAHENLCYTTDECEIPDHPWVGVSKKGESLWNDASFRRFFAEHRAVAKPKDLCRFDFFRHYQVADVLSRFDGGIFWTRRGFLDAALLNADDGTNKVFSCKDLALKDNSAEEKKMALNDRTNDWEKLRQKFAKIHKAEFYMSSKASDLWKHFALTIDTDLNQTRNVDLGYANKIKDSLKPINER